LPKYLSLAALFDLQQIWQPSTIGQKPFFGDKSESFQPNNGSGWTDLKRVKYSPSFDSIKFFSSSCYSNKYPSFFFFFKARAFGQSNLSS